MTRRRTSEAPHHDCSPPSDHSSLVAGGGVRSMTSKMLRTSSCAASLPALVANLPSGITRLSNPPGADDGLSSPGWRLGCMHGLMESSMAADAIAREMRA